MWMSQIETTYGCPIVTNTKGIIRIAPRILGILAGAVKENDEWLTILLGTYELEGLVVNVTGLYTPENQTRSSSACGIKESLYPFPASVKANLVGVLHSHHSMSARFSGSTGDNDDDGLNKRYPMSIVISRATRFGSDEEKKRSKLLGFSYEAVVRHRLVCGAWGKSYADIVPLGIDSWPFRQEPTIALSRVSVKDLGDCQRYSPGPKSNDYETQRMGNCGCSESDSQVNQSIFGVGGDEILSKLPIAIPGAQVVHGYHAQTALVPANHSYYSDRDSYYRDEYSDDSPSREE